MSIYFLAYYKRKKEKRKKEIKQILPFLALFSGSSFLFVWRGILITLAVGLVHSTQVRNVLPPPRRTPHSDFTFTPTISQRTAPSNDHDNTKRYEHKNVSFTNGDKSETTLFTFSAPSD
jgi:hypothetical protein